MIYYVMSLLALPFLGKLLDNEQSYFLAVLSLGLLLGATVLFILAEKKTRAILSIIGCVALFILVTQNPTGLEACLAVWVSGFALLSKKLKTIIPAENTQKKKD